jgi:hypothetical protein
MVAYQTGNELAYSAVPVDDADIEQRTATCWMLIVERFLADRLSDEELLMRVRPAPRLKKAEEVSCSSVFFFTTACAGES